MQRKPVADQYLFQDEIQLLKFSLVFVLFLY